MDTSLKYSGRHPKMLACKCSFFEHATSYTEKLVTTVVPEGTCKTWEKGCSVLNFKVKLSTLIPREYSLRNH
jgi:hypothetical protein